MAWCRGIQEMYANILDKRSRQEMTKSRPKVGQNFAIFPEERGGCRATSHRRKHQRWLVPYHHVYLHIRGIET